MDYTVRSNVSEYLHGPYSVKKYLRNNIDKESFDNYYKIIIAPRDYYISHYEKNKIWPFADSKIPDVD